MSIVSECGRVEGGRHAVVVAAEHHANNVLPNVVDITLDSGKYDRACDGGGMSWNGVVGSCVGGAWRGEA